MTVLFMAERTALRAASATVLALGLLGLAADSAALVQGPADDAGRLFGQAFQALERGDATNALQYAEAALELAPDDADGLLLLGRIHETRRDRRAAESAYERASAARPEWEVPYLQLAWLRIRAEEFQAAIAPLESARMLTPSAPAAHTLLGLAYRRTGRLQDAIASYEKAVSLDSTNGALWLDTALAHQAAGNMAQAALAARNAVEQMPDSHDAHLIYARIIAGGREIEDLVKAPAAYRAALQTAPEDKSLWGELAEFYTLMGMHAQAAETYEHMLELGTPTARDYMSLGFSLSHDEQDLRALDAYDRALALDDQDGWAWFYRSEILVRLDRLEESRDGLARAVELLPDELVPLLTAIRQLTQRGDYERAQIYVDQAIALAPRDAEAGLAQARLQVRTNRGAEAIPTLRQLIESAPQLIEAQYLLGQALARTGEVEESRTVLAAYQAQLQENNERDAERLRGRVGRRDEQALIFGQTLLNEGRFAAARVELEDAAELAPDNEAVWAALVRCYEGMGDSAAAAEAARRLAELRQS